MITKKILCLFDYGPNVFTGFGTVSRNLVAQLKDHFGDSLHLTIVAVNYQGPDYIEYNDTVQVTSCKNLANPEAAAVTFAGDDSYGLLHFLELLKNGYYDGIFHIGNLGAFAPITPWLKTIWAEFQNINSIQKKANVKKLFRSIIYFPVEGILHPRVKNESYNEAQLNTVPKKHRHFFSPTICQVDTLDFFNASITYTEYGYNEVLRIKPSLKDMVGIIHHGINTADFYPLPASDIEKFRKKYFGTNAHKYIIGVINKNQPRKDIPTAIFSFIEAKKTWPAHLPPPFLYLHMNPLQPMGHRLDLLLSLTGLIEGKDYMFPKTDDINCHVDIPTLNNIYNAIDVYLSTARGGGWELTVTEAMACQTPCIIPQHTSMGELGANDRAFFVDEFLPVSDTHDNLIGYMSHPDAVAEKIIEVAKNCIGANAIVINNAYNWVRKELPWNGKIKQQFVDVFDIVYFDGKFNN